MSTLAVTTITSANTTTNLIAQTGNTSGPSIILNISGGVTLASNSTTNAVSIAADSSVSTVSNTVTIGTAAYHVANGNFGIGTNAPGYKLSVAGTIQSTTGGVRFPDGTTQTTAFGSAVGSVLKQVVLSGPNDLSGTTVTNASTTFTTVLSYAYTPLSSSSYIFVNVYTRASISGSGGDSFYGRIFCTTDSTDMGTTQWRTDDRIGQWGPFYGRYTNSSTSAKTFTFQIARNSSDDTMTVYAGENNCYMIITEIVR